MSAWRRRAIEAWPDAAAFIKDPETTIYLLFFELLARVQKAHDEGDEAQLQRIYGFALWCLGTSSRDLQNAAAVAFFEHLVDQEPTRRAMPRWVPPSAFADLKSLFEARMSPEAYAELCRVFRKGQLCCSGAST
jgi:hypothetical protein